MTTMTNLTTAVTGGVDTHGQTHHAAVVDHVARELYNALQPVNPPKHPAEAT